MWVLWKIINYMGAFCGNYSEPINIYEYLCLCKRRLIVYFIDVSNFIWFYFKSLLVHRFIVPPCHPHVGLGTQPLGHGPGASTLRTPGRQARQLLPWTTSPSLAQVFAGATVGCAAVHSHRRPRILHRLWTLGWWRCHWQRKPWVTFLK